MLGYSSFGGGDNHYIFEH